MKVNPQSFFNFCASHIPLLRRLVEAQVEWNEASLVRIARELAHLQDELPETTWRRLVELQILVPTEPGASQFLVAEPVQRLLGYLFDTANPATPDMIRGYVQSLEEVNRRLARAIDAEDYTIVGLGFTEIHTTLRRIYGDLEETQRAVQGEVSAFKINREKTSVRDRFRRIVYWMERFVEPMVEIVRPDGIMAASFEQTELVLSRASRESLFNDHPALERNLRFLRLVRQHALRVFQDCRRELHPLYEALRRSSLIASGAATALDELQRLPASSWIPPLVPGLCQIRIQHVPGDAAIRTVLARLTRHPPEIAPVVPFESAEETPALLLRQLWIDALPAEVQASIPVHDLLEWITSRHPAKSSGDVLAGFSRIVFDPEFKAAFADGPEREYPAADGTLRAHPLRLEPT